MSIIDDVTNVYLQQRQGVGISICLNEPLHYSMGLCNVAGVLKAHALVKARCMQTVGQRTI